MNTTAIDDGLWSAIGEPTRRRLLDILLAAGPGTATSLGEQLPVTRQAVAKHLLVLDQAGLVHGTTVFLLSLRQLLETGRGAPDADDVKISDWH